MAEVLRINLSTSVGGVRILRSSTRKAEEQEQEAEIKVNLYV